MAYTQAIAESSKDAVLAQLQPRLDRLFTVDAVKSISIITYYTVLGAVALLLLLVIVVISFLCAYDLLTTRVAWILIILAVLYFIIIGYVIVQATTYYAKKKLTTTSQVIFNFVASQRLLDIIDAGAAEYLKSIPAVIVPA
jgi:glucan phosphoethanolaminetransferase (alkaline phosphatase superfamily)